MDFFRTLTLAWVAAVALAALSCGSSLATPKVGPHPAAEGSLYQEVPYPPPPAKVEFVSPKPQEGALWIDGEWQWRGRKWGWEPGGWVAAPAKDAFFSPWLTVRLGNGKLLFLPGSWHQPDGKTLPNPPVLRPAEQVM